MGDYLRKIIALGPHALLSSFQSDRMKASCHPILGLQVRNLKNTNLDD